MKTIALILATGFFGGAHANDCHPNGVQVNAFKPSEFVCPKMPDLDKPLVTREGALACSNNYNIVLAHGAMVNGWVYTPSLGYSGPRGMRPGQPVTAQSFGCFIYHDGVSVTRGIHMTSSFLETSIGWIDVYALRN
jgi:hypothetical protein